MTHDRRGRGPYPPEFRREAVALYRSSGKSLKLIATELGVSVESLRAWVKQHDAFSRAIVGWSMADHMRAELVVAALEMARSLRSLKGTLRERVATASQLFYLRISQREALEGATRPGTAPGKRPPGNLFLGRVATSAQVA